MLYRLVRQHWQELIVLPGLSLACALTYESAQLWRLTTSTTGLLYTYIVVGELYAIVQAGLYPGIWRQAAQKPRAERLRARFLLSVQWIIFGCVTTYNATATYLLVAHGHRLYAADAGLVAVAVAFGFRAWWRRRQPHYPKVIAQRQAQITLATGCKVVPQYIQAGFFILAGATGFSGISLLAQISLAVLRLVMSWRTHIDSSLAVSDGVTAPGWLENDRLLKPMHTHVYANASVRRPNLTNSRTSLVLNWRDFYSIVAMAIGWTLGRF